MGEHTAQPLITSQRINQILENAFGPVVRAAFKAEGLPPEWGMAIAKLESGFDPRRSVITGSDGARGGAWGICQMTLETAREELGYKGDGFSLLDPELCSSLAAKLCSINAKRYGTDLRDVAAAYNGGEPYVKSNKRAIAYADTVCRFALDYAGKFVDGDSISVA